MGISSHNPSVCEQFSLDDLAEAPPSISKGCLQAWKYRKTVVLNRQDDSLPESLTAAVPGRAFGDEIRTAMASPIITLGGSDILGILVIGLNPRSPVDEEYHIYTHFLADTLIRAASLISLPQEQRRAQKFANDMNTSLAQELRLITLQAERMEAKFSRMAAEAPTGMFVFDPEGRPLYVNEAYLAMLGKTRDDHTAVSSSTMAWKDDIHTDDSPRFNERWQLLVEQKAPLTIEHRLKRPWISVDKASGQEISGERWLLANAFPDVDSNGKVSSIQGWLTDISHRKFAENLLSRKLEDALENKRQSENFIDMVSLNHLPRSLQN